MQKTTNKEYLQPPLDIKNNPTWPMSNVLRPVPRRRDT
ncbi:Uncharacterised protein [Legionella cincinnatiensis]|uniref:Uncharacterized protein n=1 Tax=Legionella cincinnatiensis TaxID=28085 RepID=A0A378IG26_9GAMM|nr:Uncharacterised protein [Legionella cincinnatiensis]